MDAAQTPPSRSPHADPRRWITAVVLALVIGSLLTFRLSNPELHTDEITYMGRALESMAQDAVLPVAGDGTLFMNKPPMAFWLMRLAFLALGPGPFAGRFPSVLMAVGTALLLYAFGARRFGERVGILAALLFALTPNLLDLHGIRSATTDSVEILLVTSGIVALEGWRRRRRPWMLAAMVVLVAATAWVKSPFGMLVFLAILLATEIPARRAGQGTPRLGVTLAWLVGVWLGFYILWIGAMSLATSTRAVKNRLMVGQYANRLEGKISEYHVQGPGYYPLSLADDFGFLLLLPVGAAALEFVRAGRRWRAPGYEVILLLAWALAAPALGTASISKRPWYAYLGYPGMALLLAASADRLAGAVSGRAAARSALLSAVALAHAARIPAASVWPAEPEVRSLAGRLWRVTRERPVQVVAGPRFQLLRGHDMRYREARLYVRFLLWESAGQAPGPCRAVLATSRRNGPVPVGADVLELQPATRRDSGLYLIDQCGGWLHHQLGDPVSRR